MQFFFQIWIHAELKIFYKVDQNGELKPERLNLQLLFNLQKFHGKKKNTYYNIDNRNNLNAKYLFVNTQISFMLIFKRELLVLYISIFLHFSQCIYSSFAFGLSVYGS